MCNRIYIIQPTGLIEKRLYPRLNGKRVMQMGNSAAVIGAGGKMGSGIALLLVDQVDELICVDTSEEALDGLEGYLRKQLEKQEANVDALMEKVTFTTELQPADRVFEAIIEDEKIKIGVYKILREVCGPKTTYFTNTSSIPISVLDDGAELDHKIIGFHFYNPPAVQKLVEIITTDKTDPALVKDAEELGTAMGKTLVHSNDVAGFIGNGHFMRDLLYACEQVEQLTNGHTQLEAITLMNQVSQKYLVRPMGIFQLIDYVGIDVCQKILKVMDVYIPSESFHSDLIDRYLAQGVSGGQTATGSQKDGIFQYTRGRITGIYDLSSQQYLPIKKAPLLQGHPTWKGLLKDEKRDEKLSGYFDILKHSDSEAAQLAQHYLVRSREIGETLVADGVAKSTDDVNTVLTSGFYHLYGPISKYSVAE